MILPFVYYFRTQTGSCCDFSAAIEAAVRCLHAQTRGGGSIELDRPANDEPH